MICLNVPPHSKDQFRNSFPYGLTLNAGNTRYNFKRLQHACAVQGWLMKMVIFLHEVEKKTLAYKPFNDRFFYWPVRSKNGKPA